MTSRGTKVDKLYATLRDYSSAAGSAVRLVTIDEVDILAEYFSKHMGAQLAGAFGSKPVTATTIAMMQFDRDQMAQQLYDADKALVDLCVSHGMTKGDLPRQWLDATLAAGLKAAKELRDKREACEGHARALEVEAKPVAWQRRFHWPSGLAPTTWGSCTEGEFNAGRKEAALGHYQVRALYAEPVVTFDALRDAYLAGWEVSGEGYNHECGGPDKPLENKYWLTVRDATLRRIK